jgi:hypothetical protein
MAPFSVKASGIEQMLESDQECSRDPEKLPSVREKGQDRLESPTAPARGDCVEHLRGFRQEFRLPLVSAARAHCGEVIDPPTFIRITRDVSG